jgi:hypothetical protein
MLLNLMFGEERQAYTVKSGTNYEFNVVDNERSVYGNRQGLFALLKLPPVQSGRAVAKVNALVL